MSPLIGESMSEELMSAWRVHGSGGDESVVVPAATAEGTTAERAAAVSPEAERAAGLPVVARLAATAWRALRPAGIRTPVRGFGRLLES